MSSQELGWAAWGAILPTLRSTVLHGTSVQLWVTYPVIPISLCVFWVGKIKSDVWWLTKALPPANKSVFRKLEWEGVHSNSVHTNMRVSTKSTYRGERTHFNTKYQDKSSVRLISRHCDARKWGHQLPRNVGFRLSLGAASHPRRMKT